MITVSYATRSGFVANLLALCFLSKHPQKLSSPIIHDPQDLSTLTHKLHHEVQTTLPKFVLSGSPQSLGNRTNMILNVDEVYTAQKTRQLQDDKSPNSLDNECSAAKVCTRGLGRSNAGKQRCTLERDREQQRRTA